jgi:hypothetical protein
MHYHLIRNSALRAFELLLNESGGPKIYTSENYLNSYISNNSELHRPKYPDDQGEYDNPGNETSLLPTTTVTF